MLNRLWTKDFTIITLGTVVSMLGGSLISFAVSLLVLDLTGSTLLYSIFLIASTMPRIVVPMIAGPYLDRFSRKKAVYILDFMMAAMLALALLAFQTGFFSYPIMLVFCLAIGVMSSIYQVAYESLYPTLISEGNYRRAYSISSLIFTLSAVMTPISAWMYSEWGMVPIFAFSIVAYFVAAVFETQIKADESHIKSSSEKFSFARFKSDFKQGTAYIIAEKGLLVVTTYFFLESILSFGPQSLILPYFTSTPGLNEQLYSYVMAFMMFGRMVGGIIHYRYKYPMDKKFYIAFAVYTSMAVFNGILLFMPIFVMMAINFTSGVMSMTSYNIRISATQSYVPNEIRARFNGAFQMITALGQVIGQLMAGVMGEIFPIRSVLVVCYSLSFIMSFCTMFRGRAHVKPLYNRDV